MKVINLTPHPIVLDIEGKKITFPISENIARVEQTTISTGKMIGGAEVSQSKFGQVVMPEPIDGTTFIVSSMVLSALNGTRSDVVAPKTDNTAIRNELGHIVAVKGWLI
jgi:hypothetical protein